MIVAGSASPLLLASAATGYNLERSLRFRSSASAYLSRQFTSTGNQQKFTQSYWVKRGTIGVSNDLAGTDYGVSLDYAYFRFNSTDNLVFFAGTGSIQAELVTTSVYRDPSAWYHIVLQVDTTQSTASNRVRIYVNGVQVTSFSTATYPSQNANLRWNNNSFPTVIGTWSGSRGSNYFDGYMTEIHFIDGQALTPSSFGENNAKTGVWQPIEYTGTYGTNGFYLPFNTGATGVGYACSFNGSSLFNTSSTISLTGDYTLETFALFYGGGSSNSIMMGKYDSFGTNCQFRVYNNKLYFYQNGTERIPSGGNIYDGVWYHLALTRSGSTLRFFVNGTEVGSTTVTGTFSIDCIGALADGGLDPTKGILQSLRIVSGTALYTSNFTPPTGNLTDVSGTQLLAFQTSTVNQNSSSSGITMTATFGSPALYNGGRNGMPVISADATTNRNDFYPNNISLTSGVTYDSMTDVPTLTSATQANYCVMNPNLRQTGTSSAPTNGNLKITVNNTNGYGNGVGATMAASSGKWYWEITKGGTYGNTGIANTNGTEFTSVMCSTSSTPADYTSYSWGWGLNLNTGNKLNNGTSTSYGSGLTSGDVIMCAVDIDAGKIWWGRNGTWFSSGDPSAGTNAAFTNVTGNIMPIGVTADAGSNSQEFNFGQRPFAYTPPTGFKALNTFNLPTPTIGATASTQANKYFDISLWNGNSSTQNIVNSNSMPVNFVWIKRRSDAASNVLFDSVRGVSKSLVSNSTAAEFTTTDPTKDLVSFNSNGFTLGPQENWNLNNTGSTYVGWQWNAASSNTTNTSGTITSTVRANTSSGFSIVTYTGTSSNATVGHGLGVAPSMIIVKNRGNIGDPVNWVVYHQSLGNTRALYLNTTAAQDTSSTLWNNTSPTSSVFSIGTGYTGTNDNGANYVAYCFAQIAGYSSFGSYTGNGSTDGPFVFCGFRPRYILFKRTNSAADWILFDTARNTFNVATLSLQPNNSNAEETGFNNVDILSNGFKLRSLDGATNSGGSTYIYMAFAENPFKYSLAR